MSRYAVYKHTSPSGKVYIGITQKEDVKKRWRYGHGYHHNQHFFNAIVKYGWDNIDHQILASDLSLEEAANLEKELISLYTKQGICYNIAEGGTDGNTMKRSEEEKQHLSSFFKEYFKNHEHPLKGKKHSEESRKKMSEAGKRNWQEHYEDMCNRVPKIRVGVYNIQTGEYQEFNSEKEVCNVLNLKGTTVRRHVDGGFIFKNYIFIPVDSLSFEEAMQKAYNREKMNIHCGGQEVQIIQLDMEGNYIKTFPSIKQASIETHISTSGIGNVCRKKQSHAGGYLWEYGKEYLRSHENKRHII